MGQADSLQRIIRSALPYKNMNLTNQIHVQICCWKSIEKNNERQFLLHFMNDNDNKLAFDLFGRADYSKST